jgi:hypothetical protein
VTGHFVFYIIDHVMKVISLDTQVGLGKPIAFTQNVNDDWVYCNRAALGDRVRHEDLNTMTRSTTLLGSEATAFSPHTHIIFLISILILSFNEQLLPKLSLSIRVSD